MSKSQEIATWAGCSAFFGNLVGLKLLDLLSDEDAVQIAAALLVSAAVGAAVYSRERLSAARERRNRWMNGDNGTFLKQAALLTALVTSVVGIFLGVILPLYSPNSPVASQVQANADTASDDRADDQQAVEALQRAQARTIVLLREALVSSCQRGNTIRRNQMKVLRRLRLDGESIKIVDCDAVVP